MEIQYTNQLTPELINSLKSTPQNLALLCQRDNSPALPDDFLTATLLQEEIW